MPDFRGTAGNDTINQATLGSVSAGQVIYGEAGDDSITTTTALVEGGAGNDTISGASNTEVIYWHSPAGVSVNLAVRRQMF